MTLILKQGDLVPSLTMTLTDGGAALDLTTATEVRVVGTRGTTTVFDRVVTGDANGVVTMAWVAGDTDTLGRIDVEVRVTWPGSKQQTFPKDGFERVRVTPHNG